MLPRTYEGQACSLARALEIVGERWTLLLLRDAFLGVRRFGDFQATLGITPSVLAARLSHLVEAGLLREEVYCERPVRVEYVPTDRALELWPTLLDLGRWGARHGEPAGVTHEFRHDGCGGRVRVATRCATCDSDVAIPEVVGGPGPAYASGLTGDLGDALRDRRRLLSPVRG